MEIPIAMTLLTRVLSNGVSRWANVGAGALMTLVQFSSLFFGTAPAAYYIFFSIIEITTTALIAWFAWRWPKAAREPITVPAPVG